MMTVTLTPNRSNPRRYSSIVNYRRGSDEQGEYVAPIRVVDGKVERMRWRDIAPSVVDPEFAEAWAEHVANQRVLGREPA